jgi:hypothetical protein
MGTERIFAGVIRFHPNHLAVLHMHTQWTAAAAIHIAGRPDYFFRGFRIVHPLNGPVSMKRYF